MNLDFGKQIFVSPLFASLLIILAILCASTSIYLVVLFLCSQGLEIYLTSPAEAPHQVTFMLELKEGRYSDSEVFLLRTGLIGHPNRFDRYVSLFMVLSVTPV